MTDVQETQRAELVQKFPTLQRMVTELQAVTNDEDRSYDLEAIMEQILSGETDEDVFKAQDLSSVATKDYTDRPFFLKPDGISWMRSTLEGGAFPFYALIRITDLETGDELTLNGGGASFVSVLWRLADLGAFDKFPDGRPLVLQTKSTSAGFEVVLLKPYALPKASAGKRKAE